MKYVTILIPVLWIFIPKTALLINDKINYLRFMIRKLSAVNLND